MGRLGLLRMGRLGLLSAGRGASYQLQHKHHTVIEIMWDIILLLTSLCLPTYQIICLPIFLHYSSLMVVQQEEEEEKKHSDGSDRNNDDCDNGYKRPSTKSTRHVDLDKPSHFFPPVCPRSFHSLSGHPHRHTYKPQVGPKTSPSSPQDPKRQVGGLRLCCYPSVK